MKTIISLLFMLITISTVYSQERPFERKGDFGGRKGPGREMHHLRFVKNILSETCIKEAQITPEQVDILRSKFDLLDKEMFEINKKIGELSKKQVEIATKVLTTPGSDTDEMFKLTEEIGKFRIEQAKQSVKVLIVVRDTLSPDQCAKVVKFMKEERERMERRMEMMREKIKSRQDKRSEGFEKNPDMRPPEELPENPPPPPPDNNPAEIL